MNLHLHQIRFPLTGFALEIDATFDRPITGVFGASGAGKTSLLELIAGLRRPVSGRMKMDDELLCDAAAGVHLPPRMRRIGYVPQDVALFPHLNVRANLAYGCRPLPEEDAPFSLEHVAKVMEISPLLDRNVTGLSGGEQQRVGFARAILSGPRLLLLDEPMSSLDAPLKARLIPFLHRIRDEFHIPFVYVTHDARELIALCDEVLVLERGRLVERGPANEVLHLA